MFQPTADNPYLQVATDEDEEPEIPMEEFVAMPGSQPGLKRITRNGDDTAV